MLDEINKNAWKTLGENRTKTPLTVPVSQIESRKQQWSPDLSRSMFLRSYVEMQAAEKLP